jgi:predicted DNA-binding transcriptional regulator AlpA
MIERLLRKSDIRSITGYGDLTIAAMEARGHFPRRFKLNPTDDKRAQVRWLESEVMAWIEERAASREELDQ